jgi:hypothetical protein
VCVRWRPAQNAHAHPTNGAADGRKNGLACPPCLQKMVQSAGFGFCLVTAIVLQTLRELPPAITGFSAVELRTGLPTMRFAMDGQGVKGCLSPCHGGTVQRSVTMQSNGDHIPAG